MAELARIERIVLLQSADLFEFCKADEILGVAAIARERRFTAGETIYRPNESTGPLYCVVQGTVSLTGSDGKTRQAGPTSTFGYEDILSGRMRTETARAEADLLLLEIDGNDLFDLLAHNVDIVKALFRRLLAH